ncbi:hypothetical protein CANTEDRAFT_131349 [Yamadazyma tenuis ATCC 10573]|nr:uncharacterized protein CANTEDRAFT_131349 [Yamadazyma tenuis ATCC 10573]EGV61876.1 hypothetical protein CANTEDRAFT_131349 [Yamadazyma tenuis ATCC 10573]
MAPYVDFINHTDTDQCSLKIDGRGFHVSTTTTYEQGNQMYLSYGPHSNSFLLCEYGFTIPSNQWNDLDVSPVIIKQMNENQIEFLKANDYYGDYTIRKGSGVSYRTEIALAVLQEPQPQNSRKLNAYIQGLSEGEHYSAGSRLLLEAILTGPVKDYENSKHLHSNGKQDQIEERILRCIGSLYEDLKDIVDDVL